MAESDKTQAVEGNIYFPIDSVDRSLLEESPVHTRCYWKGKASYYDVVVKGERLSAAAFFYPKPWPLARRISDHVAFWQGVVVTR